MRESHSDSAEVWLVRVADGDDEAGAGEHVDFAELDRRVLLVVAGQLEDDTECVTVTFQLRALVPSICVLDGEGV